MSATNNVILIGNLARDPELSYTPNTQTAVCRFDLAVNRPRRNGEDQGADYPRIVVWGRQAESCNRYLVKGRKVAVQGRIQTGSYTNRDGVKVYTTEIVADNVEFLGGGNGNTNGGADGSNRHSAPQQPQSPPQENFGPDDMGMAELPDSFQAAEDDIPF